MFTLTFFVRNSSQSCNNLIICNQFKVNDLDSLDVTFSFCARGEDEEVGSGQPSAISFKLMSNLGKPSIKQARKSSEDTHFTEYARFEKVWAG